MLDDLTIRDQRMMFAVVTLVHLADSKEELDSDTADPRLTEKNLRDAGFHVRLAAGQDIKRILAVYYQQDVVTEQSFNFDGESFPFPSAPFTSPAPAQAQPLEAKGRKRNRSSGMSQCEMDAYRELIRENIRYDDFVREHPYDAGQLGEMVELMVEAVCSKKKNIRVAGNDFPQTVVKSRLLKLDQEHIRFVFDCLRENTTQVRNMKQYLLTVLYNAPVTIESHYAAQVNHDLYGGEAAA